MSSSAQGGRCTAGLRSSAHVPWRASTFGFGRSGQGANWAEIQRLSIMAREYLDSALDWVNDYTGDNKNLLAIGGAGAVLLLGSIYILPNGKDRHRLTGGGIKADRVKKEFDDYSEAYGKEAGAGITDRSKTGQLVDTFYNLVTGRARRHRKESSRLQGLCPRIINIKPLPSTRLCDVTDIYEWGWGLSFHFSPRLPGKGWAASEAAHESRLAAILQLAPGKKCLDVGCGVGGPMRTIASTSGAEVTGITINQYQVQRAEHHNKKVTAQEIAPESCSKQVHCSQ